MAGGYPCCCRSPGSTSSLKGSVGSSSGSILCALCRNQLAPRKLQIVVQGVGQGTHVLGCRNEEDWNQTWVLDVLGTRCLWFHIISTSTQIRCTVLSIYLEMRLEGPWYLFRLTLAAVSMDFPGVPRVATQDVNVAPVGSPPDCFQVLNGLVFDNFTNGPGWLSPSSYDFRDATATITVL